MSDFDNIMNERLNEDDGEFFPRQEANWDKLSQRLAAFEAANPLDDFDKTLNNRLNESEGEFFPRREMNWDKLAHRLTEFEAANPLPTPAPVLTAVWKRWAWTSAAAALVGVSGLLFWHFNAVKSLEQENNRLKQEVAEVQRSNKSVNPTAAQPTTKSVDPAAVQRTTQSVISTEVQQATKPVVTTTPNLQSAKIEQKAKDTPQNRQNAAIVDLDLKNNKTETGQKENRKEMVSQKRNDNPFIQMDNRNVPNSVPFDKKNTPLNEQKMRLNEGAVTQTPSVSTDILEGKKGENAPKQSNEVAIVPKVGEETVKVPALNLNNVETVAQTPVPSKESGLPSSTPTQSTPVVEKKETDETVKTAIATVDKAKEEVLDKTNTVAQTDKATTENAATPPIIKTDKGAKWWKAFLPKGFAIGLNGVYGSEIPEIRGVMPKIGRGLTAELKLTDRIALTGNADILESQFEMRERPKHFRVKDEPNFQKPNVALHHFKGEQHSRLMSLNAKYVFGQKWWAQPSVSVGHTWKKIDGRPADYVFKDLTTNEETSVPVQVEPEQVKGLWQVGVGLEKRIKRWTFGVSAETQTSFSNQKDVNGRPIASNFGILRGGVKFNVF